MVLTVSRLAKHGLRTSLASHTMTDTIFPALDVFQICMRSAIPVLVEAVGSNDRSTWSTSSALEAISILATKGVLKIFF